MELLELYLHHPEHNVGILPISLNAGYKLKLQIESRLLCLLSSLRIPVVFLSLCKRNQ